MFTKVYFFAFVRAKTQQFGTPRKTYLMTGGLSQNQNEVQRTTVPVTTQNFVSVFTMIFSQTSCFSKFSLFKVGLVFKVSFSSAIDFSKRLVSLPWGAW